MGTQLAFPRLLDMFAEAAPHLVGQAFAQTADPHYAGPIPSTPYLTRAEFERHCAEASVIVAHAGMGTILAARRAGKPLIVIPRRHRLHEHRNDHQKATAEELQRQGHAAVAETVEQLVRALADPPAPLDDGGGGEKARLVKTIRGALEGDGPDLPAPDIPLAPPVPADHRVQTFLGLRFDCLSIDEARAWVLDKACQREKFTYVVTPNVDHVVTLHDRRADRALLAAYRDADLRLNDSRILESLALLAGRPLTVVPGSDLTEALLERHGLELRSVAIVGARPEVVEVLRARFPGVAFEAHHPPFGVRRDKHAQQAIIEFVERTLAPLTFFSFGAPQSELLCSALAARGIARTLVICVGAGIEYLSGHKRRAPKVLQSLRLEWLFRLAQEPSRLARRYLIRGPRILPIWLKHRHSDRVY